MSANRLKVTFQNKQGEMLSGLLEIPKATVKGYVLFAHCFTCGKDIAAASRISRELSQRDFATLRFDFTGLGNSDGDFANTHFSSNVDDLISAADFLRTEYQAPALLIGHSLGGAAVLAAAHKIPESKGVVTIGAPASPDHVTKQFGCDIDIIKSTGKANVSLAGRDFTIKKEFLDDIESQSLAEQISSLNKPLLILHSPIDSIVSIDQAAKIYSAAKHPKSFISLHKADHLLSNKENAAYAAETVAAWASHYLQADVAPAPEPSVKNKHILVTERNKKFARDIYSSKHHLIADEPQKSGGSDQGLDPYELLLSALGACTSMTIRMYANHKQWPLDNVEVELEHTRDYAQDCEECEKEDTNVETIIKHITLKGNLSTEQIDRLMEVADRCPVHKSISHNLQLVSVFS